jgi:hypothetical protein
MVDIPGRSGSHSTRLSFASFNPTNSASPPDFEDGVFIRANEVIVPDNVYSATSTNFVRLARSPRARTDSVPKNEASNPSSSFIVLSYLAFCFAASLSAGTSTSIEMSFKEKIWSKEVFATMRLLEFAETKGRFKECVTAVGGVSSV